MHKVLGSISSTAKQQQKRPFIVGFITYTEENCATVIQKETGDRNATTVICHLTMGPRSKKCTGWVPVAHACNPSYSSGGRDQEDHGLKPD
jgi:hypothetical protein